MTKPLSPDEVNAILGLQFDFEAWLDAWVIERLAVHMRGEVSRLMTGTGVESPPSFDSDG